MSFLIYSAIISKSQLRKALENFTVAFPVSCLNNEVDVFGKCLSAAGSPEYLGCTEKQQAVSHGTQSLGSWAALSRSLTGEVFVLLCPTEGWWYLCSFGNALLPSAGQVHCVTRNKGLQM